MSHGQTWYNSWLASLYSHLDSDIRQQVTCLSDLDDILKLEGYLQRGCKDYSLFQTLSMEGTVCACTLNFNSLLFEALGNNSEFDSDIMENEQYSPAKHVESCSNILGAILSDNSEEMSADADMNEELSIDTIFDFVDDTAEAEDSDDVVIEESVPSKTSNLLVLAGLGDLFDEPAKPEEALELDYSDELDEELEAEDLEAEDLEAEDLEIEDDEISIDFTDEEQAEDDEDGIDEICINADEAEQVHSGSDTYIDFVDDLVIDEEDEEEVSEGTSEVEFEDDLIEAEDDYEEEPEESEEFIDDLVEAEDDYEEESVEKSTDPDESEEFIDDLVEAEDDVEEELETATGLEESTKEEFVDDLVEAEDDFEDSEESVDEEGTDEVEFVDDLPEAESDDDDDSSDSLENDDFSGDVDDTSSTKPTSTASIDYTGLAGQKRTADDAFAEGLVRIDKDLSRGIKKLGTAIKSAITYTPNNK